MENSKLMRRGLTSNLNVARNDPGSDYLRREPTTAPNTEQKSDEPRFMNLFWAPMHWMGIHILKLFLRNENLTIVSPNGSRTSMGAMTPQTLEWHFLSFSSLPLMLARPWYAIGAQYVNGTWKVENGSLADLLAILVRRGKHSEQNSAVGRFIFRLRRMLFTWRQRYGVSRSVSNVERHYDSGDELFESFLDSNLNYTCADFEHGATNIDDAQEIKLRNSLQRIGLKPYESLLEIGCGWGALSRLACSEYGAKVTALTLSKNQLLHCIRAAKKIHNGDSLTYSLEDYRQHGAGKRAIYDKVISIGMLEHVGLQQLDTFFYNLNRLIKPSGVALIHTISRDQAGVTNPWIDRNIFPGGYIAQVDEILRAAKANGFTVSERTYAYNAENYITTLRHWATKFSTTWRVVNDGRYPIQIRRTYEFYFAASEAAFRELDMRAIQYVFKKNKA